MNETETTGGLGRRGEEAAEQFLRQRGLRLIERNWRHGRRGEIDLIFEDDSQVIFVEVKTRRSRFPADALQAVDPRKLARLRCLAGAWMAEQPRWRPYRIDAVAVLAAPGTGPEQPFRFSWLQGVDR